MYKRINNIIYQYLVENFITIHNILKFNNIMILNKYIIH